MELVIVAELAGDGDDEIAATVSNMTDIAAEASLRAATGSDNMNNPV